MRSIIGAIRDVSNSCRNILRNALDYNIDVDKTKIDNEVYGIMRHLGIDVEKRPMLLNESELIDDTPQDSTPSEVKMKKKAINISHWKDTRIRATWPPDDDIGMDALELEDNEQGEEEKGKEFEGGKEMVERTLVDIDFDEACAIAEPLWPINWTNEKEESNLLNELIPSEWLTNPTSDSSDVKQKGVEIEPEMLQQFRSAEAEMLLVDL